MTTTLPLLLEPENLAPLLGSANIIIVDLCNQQQYLAGHIPGAIYISPAELVAGTPPAPGKLPDIKRLNALFTRIGLTQNAHVVAYDDEGGGWAGRLLWTLEVIGHKNYSYLNGGLWAWREAQLPLSHDIPQPAAQPQALEISADSIVTKEQIMQQLGNADFVVWDARGKEEFLGLRQTAARNGHIPGAIHCEWTELMDRNRDLRIRSDAKDYLAAKGITANKTIVTHCHTHHRSGLTWLVGKLLGFNIKAYPGSWSEWGNDPTTPVE